MPRQRVFLGNNNTVNDWRRETSDVEHKNLNIQTHQSESNNPDVKTDKVKMPQEATGQSNTV